MRWRKIKQASVWWLLPLFVLTLMLTGCGQHIVTKDVMQQVAESNEITWGVKGDMRLFGLTDIKSGQVKGFEVDLATAISKEVFGKEVKINFVPVNSNTRLPLLRNGNVDALIATMTITPDRKKEIDFSNSYFNAGQAILVKRGSKVKSVKNLTQGTKVIGIQGSNSVVNIKKYAPQSEVLQLADAAQAFAALKSGQGDAMTTDNGILYGLTSDDKSYHVVGGTFTKEPYGIGVNKHQKKFLSAINQALKKLEDNGDYQKLVDKWFGQIAGFDGSVVK
ncbi:glutamine ABC transporter substrate-binding protein [Lapidilactobacillus concavus]|uniref:transporter substrate-binding domain-containing protein n=1 Tax=Lapidilactobacillus concavus TaxID=287844 RepID=UPI0007090BCF|nr:transporter substrate-binding domain-containing protein [Lapidilactobacillus concavus]GEL13661.1 glutamine ABC transporter substrate-binding protein [Lapidilactobacillus concavus]